MRGPQPCPQEVPRVVWEKLNNSVVGVGQALEETGTLSLPHLVKLLTELGKEAQGWGIF